MAEWLRKKFAGKHDSYNPAIEGYTQALLNSMGPPSANEEAARKDLEINIHTIEDEGLLSKLDFLSITPEQKYVIYLNAAGDIVSKDSTGEKMPKEITIHARPVPWALAARVAMSKVIATRFIAKRDAIIYKNRVRAEFLKIKRSMTREDRMLFAPFLNQIELYCLTALDDAIDGQKMLSLKTSGRHLRVGVQTGEQPVRGK